MIGADKFYFISQLSIYKTKKMKILAFLLIVIVISLITVSYYNIYLGKKESDNVTIQNEYRNFIADLIGDLTLINLWQDQLKKFDTEINQLNNWRDEDWNKKNNQEALLKQVIVLEGILAGIEKKYKQNQEFYGYDLKAVRAVLNRLEYFKKYKKNLPIGPPQPSPKPGL
jgi:hypothetical protein